MLVSLEDIILKRGRQPNNFAHSERVNARRAAYRK